LPVSQKKSEPARKRKCVSLARTCSWPVGTISGTPGKRAEIAARRAAKCFACGCSLGSFFDWGFQSSIMNFSSAGGFWVSRAVGGAGVFFSSR
jgi:hypothetical protein